jgi:anti-sigma regulatory factor (Ser/Thr protein kinase)
MNGVNLFHGREAKRPAVATHVAGANGFHGERTAHAELRLTIRNDLDELARVNELATELLERGGVAERVVYATQLALEEVLSNVIRHGHEDGTRHRIELMLGVGAGGVELQVVDDGQEFDPANAPEVELDVPLAERRVGGLGIHLLRAFAREIRYDRVGDRNVLRLRI